MRLAVTKSVRGHKAIPNLWELCKQPVDNAPKRPPATRGSEAEACTDHMFSIREKKKEEKKQAVIKELARFSHAALTTSVRQPEFRQSQ